ncbi:MAG TPA: aminotransferase class V-fold PLP-dependent enzyme, partial [Candidatus Lokiarchaeia archaeon]
KKKTKSLDGLGGTPNFFGIFSLKASLILIKEIGSGDIQRGIACINNRILELTSYFVEELKKLNLKIISPLDSKYRSGIITIENENARNIFNKLQANNIFISFRNYPNLSMKTLLRFSFNYYNNFEDIKKCIKFLKGILK